MKSGQEQRRREGRRRDVHDPVFSVVRDKYLHRVWGLAREAVVICFMAFSLWRWAMEWGTTRLIQNSVSANTYFFFVQYAAVSNKARFRCVAKTGLHVKSIASAVKISCRNCILHSYFCCYAASTLNQAICPTLTHSLSTYRSPLCRFFFALLAYDDRSMWCCKVTM